MAEHERLCEEALPARTVFVRAPAGLDVESGPIRLGVWLVEPGDEVQEGAALAELIAPGLLLELRSPCDGIVERLRQTTGQHIRDSDTVFCELTTG